MKKNIYGVKALCRNMKGVRGREEGKGGGRGGAVKGLGMDKWVRLLLIKKRKKKLQWILSYIKLTIKAHKQKLCLKT